MLSRTVSGRRGALALASAARWLEISQRGRFALVVFRNALALAGRRARRSLLQKGLERLSGLWGTRRRAGSCAVRQAVPMMTPDTTETRAGAQLALMSAKLASPAQIS